MSVLYALIFCLAVVAAEEERRAIAVLFGAARGNVTFTESGSKVRMVGVIEGLTPGQHGFHVHEKGDVSMGCASTLGHYNPNNKQHGAPHDENRHVGDLGNILADERGVATFVINDPHIRLTGPHSVLGRAVVVHSDPDDLGKGGHPDSLTTGHAGSRVACGVIGTLETTSMMNSGAWVLKASLVTLISLLLFNLL
ncbi:superoxide dismutase [Cu-Zn] isoform X2 [Halyomorpha halys]|uniref:superoxide dismutase [Cu-Zn] isoform X2 n=1 Tax=Halyomorpha halys TaxID=286706 RepID=UPI0006D515ED